MPTTSIPEQGCAPLRVLRFHAAALTGTPYTTQPHEATIMNKYFKPRSVTWWASVTPLAIGTVIATEPLHGLSAIVQSLNNATGDMAPFTLINAGLMGIGLRGAVDA